MPIRQVTEIDRCINYLREQARKNLLLADELEAKHCQVVFKKTKKTSMKELVKKLLSENEANTD